MSLLDQDIPVHTCSRCSMLVGRSNQPAPRARQLYDRYHDLDGPRRVTIYVNPSKRPYVAPFRRVQTLERLLQYIATLPHPQIRFLTAANPSKPKSKLCEEKLSSGQWQLVDRSGCIIRPEDFEDLVHDGMDITIDTMPHDQPQEVQEERMPALEPTMQINGPKEVSVVEQNEVAGDLMDMQTTIDPLAVHQHQHVQSAPSIAAYNAPSRLFIPTYIPDTAYQETTDVTELAGEDNPEPQIPPSETPQNAFVMPPRPVPRSTPGKGLWMRPSAIEFKPGGMSSSALPLENPLFHIRQSTAKRSMAIPIKKPPTPLPLATEHVADVPDAHPVEASLRNDRDWGDESSVVVEPTLEQIDQDTIPPSEADVWGEAVSKSLPSEQADPLSVEEKEPELPANNDAVEVGSISETVIGPEPKDEPLPTETSGETQNQQAGAVQSDGEEASSTYNTEGKYDGESSLFLDEVPDTAIDDMAPNEVELPESESEFGSTVGKVALVKAKSSPYEHQKEVKVIQPPAPEEIADSEEVAEDAKAVESTELPPARVNPRAVEFIPDAEPETEYLQRDTNYKWEEEPIPEPEPRQSASSQNLDAAADPNGWDTTPAWDTNENFENEPAWTDWSTNAGATTYTDADWDNRGRVPVPVDEDSEWAPKKTEPKLGEASLPVKPAWLASGSQKPAWATVAAFTPSTAASAGSRSIISPVPSKSISIINPNTGGPVILPSGSPQSSTSSAPKQKQTSNDYFVRFVAPSSYPNPKPKPPKVSIGGNTTIRKLAEMYSKHFKDYGLLSIALKATQGTRFNLSMSKTENGAITVLSFDAERKIQDCKLGTHDIWVSIRLAVK
ncbi:hypothetical protein TWF694_007657 [Orbilia ellipsospora]|uniref:Uncharacterized protein n=1 Tax=Orbilia ellipsospora TaxID=2528407 RepID=A0AAV9XIC7_9PEZI